MNAWTDSKFLCVPNPTPHSHLSPLFLVSFHQGSFLSDVLTASKLFLISFKDKSPLIGCGWLRFPATLWRDSMGRKKEFSHIIHCGHLLCSLTQVCQLKYVPGHMGWFLAQAEPLCLCSGSSYPFFYCSVYDAIDMWIILSLCILSTSLFVFCSLDDKTLDIRACGLCVETLHTRTGLAWLKIWGTSGYNSQLLNLLGPVGLGKLLNFSLLHLPHCKWE